MPDAPTFNPVARQDHPDHGPAGADGFGSPVTAEQADAAAASAAVRVVETRECGAVVALVRLVGGDRAYRVGAPDLAALRPSISDAICSGEIPAPPPPPPPTVRQTRRRHGVCPTPAMIRRAADPFEVLCLLARVRGWIADGHLSRTQAEALTAEAESRSRQLKEADDRRRRDADRVLRGGDPNVLGGLGTIRR